MNKVLAQIVFDKEKRSPLKIKRIGGGYYADVFRFDYKDSEPIVVKVYKTKGLMEKEAEQLQLLGKYSAVPVPEVLWTHTADESFSYDVMAMNFLQGVNGGNVTYLTSAKRRKLAEQVVDSLLQFHNVHNPEGFGEIGNAERYETFNEYYKKRADDILIMAEALHNKGELTDYVYGVAQEAIKQFDRIFCLPITHSSLIHGDYNMWNILVDKKACKVTAVIDPCGCMWGDSEFDLYQLNNANGKKLGLFDVYSEKKKLSENCLQKMAFYEVFTEIEHYYKSGHPVVKRLIKIHADALNAYLL